jgi:hypothetical protein
MPARPSRKHHRPQRGLCVIYNLVTPDWTGNTTGAGAITAAVTIPKPTASRNMRWLPSGRGQADGDLTPGPGAPGPRPGRLLDERCEVGGCDQAHLVEVPVRLVGRYLEAAV